MLNNVKEKLQPGGSYFANWANLMTYFIAPPPEVAIIGADCIQKREELDNHFLPHIILLGGREEGKLPLLKNKLVAGQTTIYVCKDKTCRRPVTETEDALQQIETQ
jgi:uncharacterized protein YyaL (SSP411 family)